MPYTRTLDLVEDGIMRPVNLVASVHVGGQEPLVLPVFEHLDFVCGSVGAEHEVFVDVVAVRHRSTRVVGWEGELVKVFEGGDDGGEGGDMGEAGKVAFDEGSEGGQRVSGFVV